MTDRPELHRLSKPFPSKFVAEKQGASYVNHAIVQQRLLGTVGPFDMHVDQVIRGPFDAKTTGRGNSSREWPGRDNAVVGVVLTCTFTIDGRQVSVSEVGTPEGYYMADHDGERLKKAVSDALKRCAMRVGVALDLWSKGSYVLPAMLEKGAPEEAEEEASEPDHGAPDPDDAAVDPDGAASGSDGAASEPSGRSCVTCGGSLAGSSVEKADGGYAHKDGCPGGTTGDPGDDDTAADDADDGGEPSPQERAYARSEDGQTPVQLLRSRLSDAGVRGVQLRAFLDEQFGVQHLMHLDDGEVGRLVSKTEDGKKFEQLVAAIENAGDAEAA